jgi:hypothetical protein
MNPESAIGAKLQRGKWLRIAAYANFWDIPRRILVLDRQFVFWLLDCPFDEDKDDHVDAFSVWRVGHDARNAKAFLESSDCDAMPEERIPVSQIEFDETRRNALFVHASQTRT